MSEEKEDITNLSVMSYWENNPLQITSAESVLNKIEDPVQILSNKKLLKHVQNHIDSYKFKLNYKINDPSLEIEKICNFVNKNYIDESKETFYYTQDIMEYYINNSLVISFYESEKMIGLIIGKKMSININKKNLDSVEVNFLSLKHSLRGENLAPLMISILTKEVVLNYSIGIAHYTIDSSIKSPHYCLKYYYHRMVNIGNLFENKFIKDDLLKIDEYKSTYNTFNHDLQEQKILYINVERTKNIPDDIIKLVYDNLNLFNQYKYQIYENKTFDDIKKLFYSKSFHHFLFYENDKIKNYVCINNLEVINILNKTSYKNGNICVMFYENNPSILIEHLSEYVYLNKLFDVITWSDFFETENNYCKTVKGTGFLKYYLFNMKFEEIQNEFNGLVTL